MPYAGSIVATFTAVQEQVLASGEYIWPWDQEFRAFNTSLAGGPEPGAVPRPSTLAELNAVKEEIADFRDEGTHSILDVDRVILAGGSEDDEFGAIVPLTSIELMKMFGTVHPSLADFDRLFRPELADRLNDLVGERWSGRTMVIYQDGVPVEVYFWGVSGD